MTDLFAASARSLVLGVSKFHPFQVVQPLKPLKPLKHLKLFLPSKPLKQRVS